MFEEEMEKTNCQEKQIDFSEDIPYEYIYPSNLHEVFPKLEMLFIEPSYYSHRKEIYIPPSDPHYTLLYKEYKRQYYETYFPKEYSIYRRSRTDKENDYIYNNLIHIYPKEKKRKYE
ncbi:hypothetical protein WA158_005915 [Blastocystis sp. Blastoise]